MVRHLVDVSRDPFKGLQCRITAVLKKESFSLGL